MRLTPVALASFVALLGCGGEDETTAIPVGDCAPEEWRRDDGSCMVAGLPADMPCAPGEWQRDDGACVPAGIPLDGCGEGFIHDGDVGCNAILPRAPCRSGLMAVPGETTCHEIAPCMPGKWGDIPVDADTQYVDQSYLVGDSNGSALKPWKTIQAAVIAAAPGAIVAIAQGSYVEDVVVGGKPVRLWGVCPALVEVLGTGAELAAVVVINGANGTEAHGITLGGNAEGFAASGSIDVRLERVWIRDPASLGVRLENTLGPTSLTIASSLIEQAHEVGVLTAGAEVTMEASVVRNTQRNASNLYGHGIGVHPDPTSGVPARFVLLGSVVEQSRELALFATGSELVVETSVIRDTEPNAQGIGGRGINAQTHPVTGEPSTLELRASIIERSSDRGVGVNGTHATVESTVIRGTQPDVQPHSGRGLGVSADVSTLTPASLMLRTSVVEQNHNCGLWVESGDATVDASVIRDTQADPQGLIGRGVSVQSDPLSSTLLLTHSVIERSHEVGVFIYGSDATVEASVIRATQSNAQGLRGRGLHVQPQPDTATRSNLVLRASIIERSHEYGVGIFASTATIESSLIRDSLTNVDGLFGDGVFAISETGQAQATIIATRVERSDRAAVAALGAELAIGGSMLTCQLFGLVADSFQGLAPALEDLGGNLCGCPEATGACAAASANLAVPPPLDPAE